MKLNRRNEIIQRNRIVEKITSIWETIWPFMLLVFIVLGIVGEIMCFYKFVKCDFEPNYKAELVYGISFVTGVGAITGWMDFGK